MITIDQLLESVDLDFEPRWVTQDEDGATIFADKPKDCENAEQWFATNPTSGFAEYDGLKLADFENKDWQECIYEVPRKTTGKIKKLECYELADKEFNPTGKFEPMCYMTLIETINSLVDAVNELKERTQPITLNPDLTDEDLRKMMCDPKYWRDKDPEITQKIQNGFNRLYGDKN